MRINLSSEQLEMLTKEGIMIYTDQWYSEDAVFAFLDRIYDVEVQYAQNADTNAEARQLANVYAAIADAVQSQISEEDA